jgi:hypothetical protein
MWRSLRHVSWLLPAPASRFTPQPGDHPHDIHGCGGEEVLEVRARNADGPTLPERKAAEALREAALHPRPEGLLLFALVCPLALARGLERLVVGLRPDRKLPRGLWRCGAALTGGTGATGGPGKADAHDGSPGPSMAGGPFDPGVPLGTVGLLRVPIHPKGLEGIPGMLMLPAISPYGWPDDLDLMLRLGGDEEGRSHIAAIEPVRTREESTPGPVLLDGRAHAPLWPRGGRSAHLGEQIRRALSTGLREMALVAHPMGLPFTAVAGLHVIRGVDEHR